MWRKKMLTKEISEVEKEIIVAIDFNKYPTPITKEKENFLRDSVDLYDNKSLTQIRQMVLEEKLLTLKSAQAKFDKFVEDLNKHFTFYKNDGDFEKGDLFVRKEDWDKIRKGKIKELIKDELSSKQEGEE
jgi:hypothetical protein